MPVFSLPGKYGIGGFSKEAYAFVDFLKEAHQSYWQILPLGPTSYGDSPYQSFSTFAGNPYYIDLDTLVEEGLLTEEECEKTTHMESATAVDYGILYRNRFLLLKKAFNRADTENDEGYRAFKEAQKDWLFDYALYMTVKGKQGDVGLEDWDADLRCRKPEVIAEYKEAYADEIEYWMFLQYKFEQQWQKLKAYANGRGIQIVGDIPIYVSGDSADVWQNPQLFDLDEDFRPTAVAGCPPDAFAPDGQLWGNPLYRWDYHKETGYEWWLRRIERCMQLYDVIRIDHFRGFDQYFSIPYGDETAKNGHWVDGPNIDLFNAVKERFGSIPIIAEDLGFVTDSVRKLVADSGFPNMKVIEFAFDARDTGSASDYLPHNFKPNAVAYTGTHDNNTLMGWLDEITPEEIRMVCDYTGVSSGKKEDIVDGLIRIVLSSVAETTIIPIQDYLHLNADARINRPSTLGTNWQWRCTKEQLGEKLASHIAHLTDIYGRQG